VSQREKIAALLWTAIPSADDAEAHAIAADELNRLIAEELREAADAMDGDSSLSAAVHVTSALRRRADAIDKGERP
jgi:hypothetical protein